MSQIKKKFIADNAIDGSKIQLLNGQAVRAVNSLGVDRDLFYFTNSNEFRLVEMPRLSIDPITTDDLTRKGYVDMAVAQLQTSLSQEVSDRQTAIAAEQSARIAADADLQSQVNVEKGRIDAILSASDADKDSFAEIVALINSVDTANDSAFASYVLSNNAALAQEVSDRLAGDTTEASARQAADTALQTNINAKTLDSLADVNIVSKVDGHVIEWDATTGKWINVAPLVTASSSSQSVTTPLSTITSVTASSIYYDGGSAGGIYYVPNSDKTITKFELPLAKRNGFNSAWTVAARIYRVNTTISSSMSLYSSVSSSFQLVGTSTNSFGSNDLTHLDVGLSPVTFLFNSVQLTGGYSYVIWVEINGQVGATVLQHPLAFKYDYSGGSSSLHYKGVSIYRNLDGDSSYKIEHKLYTGGIVQSTSSPTSGLIKSNSSGLLDQSFLAYDIDFGGHKLQGVSAPVANTDATNKQYVDSSVSSEASLRSAADLSEQSARIAADAAEAAARQAADTTLQTNINAEASARQAGDAALQTQINNILSNTDATALNSLAEVVAAFQAADNNLNGAITALSAGSSSALTQEISDRQAAVAAEEAARIAADAAEQSARMAADAAEASARQAGDAALQASISQEVSDRQAADAAEQSARIAAVVQLTSDLAAETVARTAAALVFVRFSGQLTSTDITNGYFELIHKVKHESVSAFIDRLALRHELDYTLSDVNGKTRISFVSGFTSGAEAPAIGDLVHGNYAYANEDQPSGGSSGGGSSSGGSNQPIPTISSASGSFTSLDAYQVEWTGQNLDNVYLALEQEDPSSSSWTQVYALGSPLDWATSQNYVAQFSQLYSNENLVVAGRNLRLKVYNDSSYTLTDGVVSQTWQSSAFNLQVTAVNTTASFVSISWNSPSRIGDSVQLFSTSGVPLSSAFSLLNNSTMASLSFSDTVLDDFIAVGDTVIAKYMRNGVTLAQAQTTFPVTDGLTITLTYAAADETGYYVILWNPAGPKMGKPMRLQKQDSSGYWIDHQGCGTVSSGEAPLVTTGLVAGTKLRLRSYLSYRANDSAYTVSNQVVSAEWVYVPFQSV